MKIYGKTISKGVAEGEAVVTREAITFLGGVDPKTGVVVEKGHELEGVEITGKVLIFPKGKGSTVGTYVLYQMKKNGTAPLAIVNTEVDLMVATGAIISEIPMVLLEEFPDVKTGERVVVDGDGGWVEWD